MDSVVPLHALVMMVGGDGMAAATRLFPPHEIITPNRIALDLVGHADRPDLAPILLTEMRHRVALKLSLGERVVITGHDDALDLLRPERRLAFARLATAQGASVMYVLDGDSHDAALHAGDGVASVATVGQGLRPALPLPSAPLSTLRERYRGVTILGDVHGCLRPMQEALAWARSRNHFVWFLGDVVDCGVDTLDTLVCAYHVVMRGEGAFILGNHERKIARWLAQQQDSGDDRMMRLSDGNQVTTDALADMPREARTQWCGRFRSLLGQASLMTHLGDVTFVHAAVHPDVWHGSRPDHAAIEDYALYGETNSAVRSAAFALSYRWIDALPAGRTVFVGHDVRSTVAPLAITGARGGRVVFLDTGSGKGGALSSADLRFTGGGLRLENFNRH